MRVTVYNRGPEAAPLHVLPQLWFRNTWSWRAARAQALRCAVGGTARSRREHAELGSHLSVLRRHADGCSSATTRSTRRGCGTCSARPGFWKDALPRARRRTAHARRSIRAHDGTKAARLVSSSTFPRGGQARAAPAAVTARARRSAVRRFRRRCFERASREADEFYAHLQEGMDSADARAVQRQAFAGMIWSKQFFYFDVPAWLRRRSGPAAAAAGAPARTQSRMGAS